MQQTCEVILIRNVNKVLGYFNFIISCNIYSCKIRKRKPTNRHVPDIFSEMPSRDCVSNPLATSLISFGFSFKSLSRQEIDRIRIGQRIGLY